MGILDTIRVNEIHYIEARTLQNTPVEREALCTAAEICRPNHSCRKKPNAGKDRLKACVKGLYAFKLAPKLPFAHAKLSSQLFC